MDKELRTDKKGAQNRKKPPFLPHYTEILDDGEMLDESSTSELEKKLDPPAPPTKPI